MIGDPRVRRERLGDLGEGSTGMANRAREVTKFLAGVAAEETTIHWALGFSDVLPLKIVGVTITPTLNTIAMVAWPIVAALLIYYAWVRRSAA